MLLGATVEGLPGGRMISQAIPEEAKKKKP